jgi:uncharacterized GH25 family protein
MRTVAKVVAIAISGLSSTVLLLSAASAHDIWLVKGAGGAIEVDYGDLTERLPPVAARLVSLTLVSDSGKTDLRATKPQPGVANGYPVLLTKPIEAEPGSVVEVSNDNGFYIVIPGDKSTTNTSPLMVPNGTGKKWIAKYAKLLLGPDSYKKVLGARVELVALKDPFTNPGDTLPVKLLYNGKPYSGAEIAYTDGLEPLSDKDQPKVKTGPDGVAMVPFREGRMLLTAELNVDPMHPPLADVDNLYVALTFETPK